MPFIQTPPATASEKTAAMYDAAEASYGYVPNMYRAFGHRPEVMENWGALLSSIRGHMTLRRYELVTLAAAKELKSSYCMLAHGSVLLREGFTDEGLTAVVAEAATAPISEEGRAVMAFAAKVARDATSVAKADVDRLKGFGLSDAEVFDITAAASVRCFFSKMLDALGAEPDHIYSERLEAKIRSVLTVGRKIDGTT